MLRDVSRTGALVCAKAGCIPKHRRCPRRQIRPLAPCPCCLGTFLRYNPRAESLQSISFSMPENGTPLSPEGSSLPDKKLVSWKEIAVYLGREVRTVQRWENTEGLPVHRHEH